MSRGRLEAQVYIATAWTGTITVTAIGGPSAVTLAAAGSYYPSALLTTIQTNLDAAFGGDGAFTVSASWGESGTGIVTIAHATQTFTITGVTVAALAMLGFAGDLTPAALTFSGTKSAQGVFLPNAELAPMRGPTDTGIYEAVMPQTVSPTGAVKTFAGSIRVRLPPFVYSHVPKAYALRNSDSTGTTMSFERWWYQTQAGGLAYFKAGSPVNVYTNADTPTLLGDYKLLWRDGSPNMEKVDESWDGIWRCWIEGYEI